MKPIWIRLISFLAIFGIAMAACFAFSNPETNPVAGVVAWLPEESWDYEVVSQEMSKLEKDWLPADTTYIRRQYYEKFRQPDEARLRALSATLIVAGSDSRSLHRPEVCLTGQHWTITRRELVSLKTKGGPLQVMDFHLQRKVTDPKTNLEVRNEDGSPLIHEAHYVYWWVGPDASTASDKERVWLELKNSITKGRKERWAYPSVQVNVDNRYGRGEAQERAYKFIREYAPDFQRSLGATDRPDAIPLKSTSG